MERDRKIKKQKRSKPGLFGLIMLAGLTGLAWLLLCTLPCLGTDQAEATSKMIILGFDGMDPGLLQKYMDAGMLPNFKKLAQTGDFKPLTTTIPPQSPVAWATFITGQDPGGTNIYDFIARDPNTYLPYLSIGEICPPKKEIKIPLLHWVVPISKVEAKLYRKGRTFWEYLDDVNVSSTILQVPSNFPPVQHKGESLSGMGTPDLIGTYGTFQFYTSKAGEGGAEQGGKVYHVEVKHNVIETQIQGPVNSFKEERPISAIPLTITLDPKNPVARLKFADQNLILKEGSWTGWLPLTFNMSFSKAAGIGRFYLKQVRPEFQLYLSPVNVDPRQPPFSISCPEDYAKELAEKIGLFHTQGIPEDTWALNEGRLSEEEFLQQSEVSQGERLRMYRLELANLKKQKTGLLFCYFSATDTIQHMFTGFMDPQSPIYTEEKNKKYGRVIPDLYQKMDKILAETMKQMDPGTTLLVLSDHGFTSFRRYFNLNTWLHQNGYMAYTDEYKRVSGEFFDNVNWKRTKAYAMGLTALYLNLKGREGQGIVKPGKEARALLEQIRQGLLNFRDPKNGQQVISYVDVPATAYKGKYRQNAPDLIIGYNRGYRASWWTALGQAPEDVVGDNTTKWSGDHCIAGQLVPGIVLANKKFKVNDPAMIDLAPTILHEFNVGRKPADMPGRVIF
jgi:predicted AlkP superfamily phosphohydrolase/phosphomutase